MDTWCHSIRITSTSEGKVLIIPLNMKGERREERGEGIGQRGPKPGGAVAVVEEEEE